MFSEMFGDYQKLLKLGVLGKEIEVPEKNSLLRGFQYASPETISYGRFCWNGSCNNCSVTVLEGSKETKQRACKTAASEGMRVVNLSRELTSRLKSIVTRAA